MILSLLVTVVKKDFSALYTDILINIDDIHIKVRDAAKQLENRVLTIFKEKYNLDVIILSIRTMGGERITLLGTFNVNHLKELYSQILSQEKRLDKIVFNKNGVPVIKPIRSIDAKITDDPYCNQVKSMNKPYPRFISAKQSRQIDRRIDTEQADLYIRYLCALTPIQQRKLDQLRHLGMPLSDIVDLMLFFVQKSIPSRQITKELNELIKQKKTQD